MRNNKINYLNLIKAKFIKVYLNFNISYLKLYKYTYC